MYERINVLIVNVYIQLNVSMYEFENERCQGLFMKEIRKIKGKEFYL